MKVALTADLHLHTHKGLQSRLEDGLAVLEWICQTAIERNCDEILFPGDLYQDRQKIHSIVYQKTFQIFQKYANKIKWRLLIGNHDMYFGEKWDISSLFPMNAISNVEIISKPCSTLIGNRWFDWLPFVKNPIKVIQECFPPEKRNDRVLCAHIAVHGAKQNYYHSSEVSVEFEGEMVKVETGIFSGWSQVFLGHYHVAQFLGERIQYLGSPYQINFSEAYHIPHIVIFDTETLLCEYIENTFSPRHLIVDEDKLDTINVNNNFIQVRGNLSKFDAFQIKKDLLNSVRSIEFRATKEKEVIISDVKDKFNITEGKTFERYLDTVGTNGLDKDKLLSIALGIINYV